MRQAPFGHDRAAARHDAGDAVGGEMDVAEPHAGMDGEIIDALLGLLDQRVAVDLPVELDRIALHLLQRLIDRHRADRHRRVADDPFARGVDVRPVDRSITVSAPQRIAHTIFSTSSSMEEVTAELPILALILVRKFRPMIIGSHSGWLILAGMMARPRATSLRTNSGVTKARNRRAEALPVGEPRLRLLGLALAADILAMGDIDHLLGDDAGPRQLELRDRTPASAVDPRRALRASPRSTSMRRLGIGARARRVVDAETFRPAVRA